MKIELKFVVKAHRLIQTLCEFFFWNRACPFFIKVFEENIKFMFVKLFEAQFYYLTKLKYIHIRIFIRIWKYSTENFIYRQI